MTSVMWFIDHFNDRILGEWWTRRWVWELARRLKTDDDPAHWTESVTELRAELNEVTLRHAATPFTAAHLHFALDLVDTINPVQEHRHMAPGYLLLVALTDEEHANVSGVFPEAPVCNPPQGISLPPEVRRPRRDLLGRYPEVPLDGRLPLASLPGEWLSMLLRRDQIGVLRSLYQLTHERASASVLTCVRDSRHLTQWHEGMALQIVAFAGQMITRVTPDGTTRTHGEGADDPGLDALYEPLPRLLFSPEELTSLRQQEAYMHEQFAHLFAAVVSGRHLQESVDSLASWVGEARSHFLEIRKELRAMRGRYLVPPYLVPELDALLKAAAARASAAAAGTIGEDAGPLA
ncbi:hypothetical protein [Streptomyces sp. NBC_00572]|uniref:hypothetical protein n=1 Tax=Streptomyces sp. NBC_00572 TaxID=2903664 RepID=UPI002253DB05|nr:hypothetical protein [Streptomyces sp. NBC_00572]MCX4986570.1 hypothetical protein [Streptomyces sp. NBC_00572]